MFLTNRKYCFIFILFILLFGSNVNGQILIKGVVVDSLTNEGLPFIPIRFVNPNTGISTDENGNFQLRTTEKNIQFKISYMGYYTYSKSLIINDTIYLRIPLQQESTELEEVVITNKKSKYRNKNNPAVELIQKVIEHKDSNRITAYESIRYQEYEKIQFALSNTLEKIKENRLVKKYLFLTENIDTTRLKEKAILTLYMEEILSDNYRISSSKSKKIITGHKKVTFDEDFFDNEGIGSYLKYIYPSVDVFDANIFFATNQFLSPVANTAPSFYKYFISDTIEVNGEKYVDLYFFPRNRTDLLFIGNMHVTLDGNYAVSKINLKIDKNINLNWIKDLQIAQEFEKNNQNRYVLSKSRIGADFGITKNSDGGIFGDRTTSYRNYQLNETIPDSLFLGEAIITQINADKQSDAFWLENRHNEISEAEETVYTNIDSLQNTKSFKRVVNIATMLLAGYLKVTKYVEVGPFNTFYSFNPIEGFRLRFGGRTTQNLSKHVYLEGYGAYGFKDHKWKYYIGGTYSLTGKNRFEFPAKGVNINYQQDTKIPGQELQFIQEDNILLSFKRGVNDKWLYNNIFNIEYYQEFKNNISYKIGYKNWEQQAAGGLKYINDKTNDAINRLTTSEMLFEIRWAPHQQFYQGKTYRTPFPNKYPVLTLRGAVGMKDFLNGDYTYQRLNLNVYKRFYLSQLGFSDVVLEGGYTFGKVPYPLLEIHRANQTYAYQLQSYNMMNFLEFVSDHFVSLQIEHSFNGFFLNKIPLIKKLKLREYISFKILYGGLRNENTPSGENDRIYSFPVNENGEITTFSLEKQPYMEGSIGIGNIFKLFRIDLVRRFNYLGHPNAPKYGIRVRFKLDF